jgi:hypothetical protein
MKFAMRNQFPAALVEQAKAYRKSGRVQQRLDAFQICRSKRMMCFVGVSETPKICFHVAIQSSTACEFSNLITIQAGLCSFNISQAHSYQRPPRHFQTGGQLLFVRCVPAIRAVTARGGSGRGSMRANAHLPIRRAGTSGGIS